MKIVTTIVILASLSLAQAFVPSTAHKLISRTCVNTSEITAKKKTNKRSSGGGGGGFGSKTSTITSKSGRVRSVSGYTGSGTKPLRNAANTFDTIRKIYGRKGTSDLYMRSPLNDEQLFWFVGKVVRRLDMDDENMTGSSIPTEMEAVISQKRLIIEYAKNQLRPQNFGGPYAQNLEIWIAPGDTEMDVVQNKISFVKVAGSTADLSETFSVHDVGFNPEIYIGDEQKEGGLRVSRDGNGHPVKDVFEINE
mmetsp:Transcript_19005/g.27744  ORF Transcript_19005/g.27744 Transcript_19005/m.27744 type:complete len:251 (-) Transcript_19005:461-1213(-)